MDTNFNYLLEKLFLTIQNNSDPTVVEKIQLQYVLAQFIYAENPSDFMELQTGELAGSPCFGSKINSFTKKKMGVLARKNSQKK